MESPVISEKQKVLHRDYMILRRNHSDKLYGAGTRLGQAFLNTLAPDVTFPELFYCKDDHAADRMIYKYFIKYK